ncbi:MAG TPA: TniQ family protein, partial [Ktedonobacteraceae bacterium]
MIEKTYAGEPLDEIELVVPPRSRLYHLKPIGIETPRVESLTSFIARLAEAHCVTVRKLVLHVMLPLYGKSYLPSRAEDNNISAFWKDSSTFNGTSASAGELVRVLEELTHRDNLRMLTMLPWAEALSCKDLIRRTKAWCPCCYQEWLQEGKPIYDPLLWSLEIVTFCTRHAIWLQEYCPYCKRHLTMLAAQVRLGCCSHCGAWLGITAELAQGAQSGSVGNELNWQHYLVRTVGELLAASPLVPSPPDRERFSQAIAVCLEYCADGKVSVLARKLGLSRRTIRDWKQGVQVPKLAALLQCCYT